MTDLIVSRRLLVQMELHEHNEIIRAHTCALSERRKDLARSRRKFPSRVGRKILLAHEKRGETAFVL